MLALARSKLSRYRIEVHACRERAYGINDRSASQSWFMPCQQNLIDQMGNLPSRQLPPLSFRHLRGVTISRDASERDAREALASLGWRR